MDSTKKQQQGTGVGNNETKTVLLKQPTAQQETKQLDSHLVDPKTHTPHVCAQYF